MVEETAHVDADACRDLRRRRAPKQNIGRQRRGHLTRRPRGPTRRPAESEPRSARVAAIGCAQVEVFAQAARRDSFDRQRSDRAGHAAQPRPDLRREPLHAGAVVEAHGGVAETARARARHASRRSTRRSTPAPNADVIIFSGGSSVGDRDLLVDLIAAARRDDLSRHRRQAGKADAVRDGGRPAVLRHAGQSDVVPVERLHPAGALPASHRAPAALRTAHRHARRSAAASSRQADRHQFYTVRLRRHRAFPRSRDREISPASPRPTATSRYRPASTRWKKARLSK